MVLQLVTMFRHLPLMLMNQAIGAAKDDDELIMLVLLKYINGVVQVGHKSVVI